MQITCSIQIVGGEATYVLNHEYEFDIQKRRLVHIESIEQDTQKPGGVKVNAQLLAILNPEYKLTYKEYCKNETGQVDQDC